MYLNLIGTLAILILAGICGLVAFSFYFDCDPKSTNRISRYDQILLLFAIDLFKDIPGMSGVFIACIYAASLRFEITNKTLKPKFIYFFIDYLFNI